MKATIAALKDIADSKELKRSMYQYKYGDNMVQAMLKDIQELLESVSGELQTTKYLWVKYDPEPWEPLHSVTYVERDADVQMYQINDLLKRFNEREGVSARIGAMFPEKELKHREGLEKEINAQVIRNKK